ncbi:LamG-like jellyroll fold domain-containing protein [Subtercola sp. RTI3]|uniref:LamG-like jellyroll fold domain-containing protein n=1 Tax=Subtercola sp. RTI3 TaxID=3048639 RepID=UPI002B22ADA4|nr:LamG-like jellyroll fold domain-containing protein [Subtercola sp. RTI3]MEA9984647.1 PA14 domain-containing protein [Subtercola sp. RTI3]
MTQHPPRRGRASAGLALLVTSALALGGVLALASPAAASPAGQLLAAPALPSVHGLKGEYFLSSAAGADDLAELKATRLDSSINFPDLVSAYQDLTGRNTDTAARWTGEIAPKFSEDYTFSAIGDNGFRVWINGTLVIDHWQKDWDNEQTAQPITLVAGTHYDVKVEQFQETGGANMFLRWQSASQAREIVPADAFYAPAGYPAFAADAAVPTDGQSVALTFPNHVEGLDSAITSHLAVTVSGQTYPLDSVTVADARHLTLALGAQIDRNVIVRISYDGLGTATSNGAPVPAFDLPVINGSTYAMQTEFSATIDKSAPLPEYPRPQLVRDAWQNLNGPWQFSGASETDAPPVGQTLAETVTVPYPIESYLSGIERHEDHMFYKRSISVPADWKVAASGGNRLQLNFGAVDYRATVWLNGVKVGEHTGGYLPFTVDLTDALKSGADQELIVGVTDTTSTDQPVGKQRANPSGIFYTPSSGIWQTVWMEPVAPVSIDSVVATPNIHANTASVTVASASANAGDTVTVIARDANGAEVGRTSGSANSALTLPVPNAHLWSPDDPYLYGLDVSITGGDSATSYFGMRSIAISTVNGVQKITLNDKPTFLLSTLDQGYWPESQYTQPTDAALKFDLQQTKNMAFNTIRKHIKVESARFYYYADTLGLMVWQDAVPGGTDALNSTATQNNLVDEMHQTVDALKGFTSIIGWTIFNEGWSEWNTTVTGQIADSVKAQDPSRLVNARSGLNCCNLPGDSGKGDVIDWHSYPGPGLASPDPTRAAVDGEHGGFSYSVVGHTWPGAFAPYQAVKNSAELTAAYVANTKTLIEPARTFLSGSVYTQISDVEGEVNGFFTYDRRVAKMDLAQVRAVNLQVVAAGASAGNAIPTAPGLVGDASWPFDEGSGTAAADVTGNGHDLTLQGGAGWSEGHSGSAVQLSGAGQFASASAPTVDTAASYTVSARVKLDTMPANWVTALSQEGTSGQSSFFLQYGHGGFAFSLPGEKRAVSTTEVELGRWYQLTGVWDSAKQEARLYVDGVLAGSVATGGVGSAGRTLVGAGEFNGALVDFWPGAIDEVHAYSRVLTEAEIVRVVNNDLVDAADPGTPVDPGTGGDPGTGAGGPSTGGTGSGATPLPGAAGNGSNGSNGSGSSGSGGLANTGLEIGGGVLAALLLLALGAGAILVRRRHRAG